MVKDRGRQKSSEAGHKMHLAAGIWDQAKMASKDVYQM